MIHVITGNGKGKTTAAIGIAIRAAGHGWRITFVQFLKDGTSGEIGILKDIDSITVVHVAKDYGFICFMTEEQRNETKVMSIELLEKAQNIDSDMLILDEAIDAMNIGVLDQELIKSILKEKKEIVLTGRDAPKWLIDCADYVSEISCNKHPYTLGVKAREGIEY